MKNLKRITFIICLLSFISTVSAFPIRNKLKGENFDKNSYETLKGIVKFYNHEKGFGSIISDKTGIEYLVFRSGLRENGSISEGNKVEFEIFQYKKGVIAINVKVI